MPGWPPFSYVMFPSVCLAGGVGLMGFPRKSPPHFISLLWRKFVLNTLSNSQFFFRFRVYDTDYVPAHRLVYLLRGHIFNDRYGAVSRPDLQRRFPELDPVTLKEVLSRIAELDTVNRR